MTNRRVCLVLCVALVAVSAACGGGDDDAAVDSVASEETTTSAADDTTTSSSPTSSSSSSPSSPPSDPYAAPTVTDTTATTSPPASPTTRATSPPTTAAPAPPTTAAASRSELTIENFTFSPAVLRISVGTEVRVTNKDSAPHSWTADDGSFDSGTLEKNGTYTHKFSTAGTFAYHCEIHPSMKGTVQVS